MCADARTRRRRRRKVHRHHRHRTARRRRPARARTCTVKQSGRAQISNRAWSARPGCAPPYPPRPPALGPPSRPCDAPHATRNRHTRAPRLAATLARASVRAVRSLSSPSAVTSPPPSACKFASRARVSHPHAHYPTVEKRSRRHTSFWSACRALRVRPSNSTRSASCTARRNTSSTQVPHTRLPLRRRLRHHQPCARRHSYGACCRPLCLHHTHTQPIGQLCCSPTHVSRHTVPSR